MVAQEGALRPGRCARGGLDPRLGFQVDPDTEVLRLLTVEGRPPTVVNGFDNFSLWVALWEIRKRTLRGKRMDSCIPAILGQSSSSGNGQQCRRSTSIPPAAHWLRLQRDTGHLLLNTTAGHASKAAYFWKLKNALCHRMKHSYSATWALFITGKQLTCMIVTGIVFILLNHFLNVMKQHQLYGGCFKSNSLRPSKLITMHICILVGNFSRVEIPGDSAASY